MSSPGDTETGRTESPDPASHATNIYDTEGAEGDWIDEEGDDDMDFEPTTEGSEDIEFFEATEDDEGDFHGIVCRVQLCPISFVLSTDLLSMTTRCGRWAKWC